MIVLTHLFSILTWPINLFNPPALGSMSSMQKIGRIFLVTITLVVSCILLAMLGALGIFIVERGHAMISNTPELISDLGIIFVSVSVNALCVMVLLQIRKADHKLMLSQPVATSSL